MTAKSPEEALDLEDGLVSGRLWDEYCDAIKRVGRHLLRPEAPHDVFNQAEGMRYLTRMVRAGLELMVEAGTPEFPRFSDPAGGFNQDRRRQSRQCLPERPDQGRSGIPHSRPARRRTDDQLRDQERGLPEAGGKNAGHGVSRRT